MKNLLRLSFAGFAAALLSAASSLLAQTPPAIFVTLSTGQVASGATPAAATTSTIAAPGPGWTYSAAAPVAGNTWNIIQRPNPLIGSNSTSTKGLYVCNSANNIALTSSTGVAAAAYLTVAIDVQDLESNTTRVEPNTGSGGNTVLGPNGLMDQAWRIYRGGNSAHHTFSGLTPGANYYLYVYGSTTAAGQGARFTLAAANVPGGNGTTTTFVETRGATGGNVFALSGSNYAPTTPATVNTASTSADTATWGRLHAVVDSAGKISFKTTGNGVGNFSNGYQLTPYPTPEITLQPPASASASVGGSVTLTVTATGDGTLTYQWRKGGEAIADGASGSGSTYAGATTQSLTISDASSADDGSYDVVISNPGGSTVSSATALTVTSGAIAPTIVANPTAAKVVSGANALFAISANGTAPLSYQWQKSLNNVDFTDIADATSSSLGLSSVGTAAAGYYRVIVTNSVGSVTSTSASLTVAPVIVTAPSATIVSSGAAHTLSVAAEAGAGSPEAITYVWKRDGATLANGANLSGAATASLAFGVFSAAESGVYTVTVSNSAGSVTSTPVYVGIASTQSVTRVPAAGAVGINPDSPLSIRFPSAPRIGSTGKISVRRSSDDLVMETIDLGALQTVSSSVATYRYQSKNVGGSGGGTYNYTPVVILGNEARVTLKSGSVLAYGTSYYVTIEPGAILDSTGASLAPVLSAGAWSFTTKAAAPDPVPTKTLFTVAADGSGDFSTVQGLLDFIPAGNTTPLRIEIKAGVYDEIINTGSRHNLTFVGEGPAATIIQYGNSNVLNAGSAGRTSFYAKGNDLLFRNLSLVNTTPKGGSQAEALRSDGQRVVLIDCAFRSFQDTLLLGGTSYFQDCLIAGDTDYIWGGGTAMFKNCELLCLNPADLTQARTPADRFGFVFLNCALTKPAGSGISYGLGRNSDNSNVAFIDCRMDTHISAAGWSNAFGSVNLRNWEYNSRNLAGTAAINVSQRVYGRQLTATEADVLRIPANVYGLTTDGTPAGAQGGGWVPVFEPSPLPVIAASPQSRSLAAGQSVTFTVGASGSAAFTYQWRRNGSPIAGAVAASYTIAAVAYADAGSFDCVVTNSSGSTTSAAATLTVLSPVAVWADGFGLDGSASGFASADADGDGLANLLEYVLGGNPTASDAPGRAPIVTVVEDAGGKHLVLEYVRAVAASAVPVSVETSPDLATWTARSDGVDAEIEIIPFIGQGINVDVNTSASGNYTGLAAAPGDGVTWNSFLTTTPTLTDVRDSQGNATATDVVVASSGFSAWSQGSNGSPNPLALMQDYLFNSTYTVTLNSLPAGSYRLYVYAHGDQDSQVSTVTVAAANGGGTKGTAANGGAFRDAFAAGAEGVAYVKFSPVVGAGGTLQFSVGPFLNGFQLVQLTDPDHERVRVTIPFTGARLFARLRAVE